jgi:hypothetical protein
MAVYVSQVPELLIWDMAGVILPETQGVSVAIDSLAKVARRAAWAMISRFRVCKFKDM